MTATALARGPVEPPSETGVAEPLPDREAQIFLALAAQLGVPPIEESTAAEARALFARPAPKLTGTPPAIGAAEDLAIPGPGGVIKARLYHPAAGQHAEGPSPLLVYYHGGGWVIGDLDTHDGVCRALCAHGRGRVLSVDYRLAPEHPFPAAVEDAWAALAWAQREALRLDIDPARIAVGGDSAGGNLAAVVSLMDRDSRAGAQGATGAVPPLAHPVAFQLLIYPSTDMTASAPSHQRYAEGYGLTAGGIDWFVKQYLGMDQDRRDPRASPEAASHHRDLPPALVVTAGFDPLIDEGRAYADRLRMASVPVEEHCFPGMIHGFVKYPGLMPQARHCLAACGAALARAWRV